jgi:hypothetical protein
VGAELVAVGGGGDHLAEGREALGRGLHRPRLHKPSFAPPAAARTVLCGGDGRAVRWQKWPTRVKKINK